MSIPFQNLFIKNASEAAVNALNDAAKGIDENHNGVPDIVEGQGAFAKIFGGLQKAISASGFLPFIQVVTEAAAKLDVPAAKEGMESAIEGAHELYAIFSGVISKFSPPKA